MSSDPAPRALGPMGLLRASWRLFARAPRPALALWGLASATCVALDRGATQQVMALAHPSEGAGRMAPLALTTLAGWACDCLVQALWAQLAWQALSGEPTGLLTMWRRLAGAWTGVGLLVAYASLSVAALAWPQLLQRAGQLDHPGAWALAAAVLVATLAWVAVRVCLGVPAAAAERRGSRAAWAASWRLTRGRLGTLVPLLLLGPACGLGVSILGGALPEVWRHQATAIAVVAAAAQCALGGLPGTIYWAWRRQEQEGGANAPEG